MVLRLLRDQVWNVAFPWPSSSSTFSNWVKLPLLSLRLSQGLWSQFSRYVEGWWLFWRRCTELREEERGMKWCSSRENSKMRFCALWPFYLLLRSTSVWNLFQEWFAQTLRPTPRLLLARRLEAWLQPSFTNWLCKKELGANCFLLSRRTGEKKAGPRKKVSFLILAMTWTLCGVSWLLASVLSSWERLERWEDGGIST